MLVRNRIALWVVGTGLLVGTAYATLTSDAVVERVVRGQFATLLRAPCSFSSAHFTFLEGLVVRDLVVLDPEDPFGPPLVTADEADVDYVLDVFGRGPRLTRVGLVRPHVRIERRPDGSFPLAVVWRPPEGAARPKPEIRLDGGVGGRASTMAGAWKVIMTDSQRRTASPGARSLRSTRCPSTVRPLVLPASTIS